MPTLNFRHSVESPLQLEDDLTRVLILGQVLRSDGFRGVLSPRFQNGLPNDGPQLFAPLARLFGPRITDHQYSLGPIGFDGHDTDCAHGGLAVGELCIENLTWRHRRQKSGPRNDCEENGPGHGIRPSAPSRRAAGRDAARSVAGPGRPPGPIPDSAGIRGPPPHFSIGLGKASPDLDRRRAGTTAA